MNKMLNESLLIGIILLIIVTSVNPMVIGKNARFKDNNQATIFGEPPDIQWTKTFGDKLYNDIAYDVKSTKDGGFIIVGMTRSYGPDHYYSGWLIKTDSNGTEEWNETYGEPGSLNIDSARSGQQTSDGGYIFTGLTHSYSSYENEVEIWLVKTYDNGTEDFNRVYGGDRGYSVKQTKDGGYIVCGDDKNSSAILLKTDVNGNESWRRTYWGYPGDQAVGYSVDETKDEGFVFTGPLDYYENPEIFTDIFLIKTDRNGTEEINVKFGSIDRYEVSNSVHHTNDGGCIITGFVNDPDDWIEAWLIKTDENGNMEWNKTFGEPYSDYFGEDVIQCSDGGYAITGKFISNYDEYSSWLIRTDSQGNKTWQVSIPTAQQYDKIIHSVDETVDGGYILAGEISPNGIGDALLIKIASEDAPDNPKIDGPSRGRPDEEYDYTIVTTDPNNEQVYYWIEWGDSSNTGWLGPYDSGVEIIESHSWSSKGIYTIQVKAKNINDIVSSWSTFDVSIPRTQARSINVWYNWFFKHFPFLERLLPLSI